MSESSPGRAAAYRSRVAGRRRERLERTLEVAAVVVILVGVYAVLTARPVAPGSNPIVVPTGPPIRVQLGDPVTGSIACGAGGNATLQTVPWENATAPVTTGVIQIRVVQLGDGDVLGDNGVGANATPGSACAGSPPTPTQRWYGVLAGPNGTNLATFTFNQEWHSTSEAPWDVPVENGSLIRIVENPSLAGVGYGLQVVGFVDGSEISGLVSL